MELRWDFTWAVLNPTDERLENGHPPFSDLLGDGSFPWCGGQAMGPGLGPGGPQTGPETWAHLGHRTKAADSAALDLGPWT
jgi:hypothetical protein